MKRFGLLLFMLCTLAATTLIAYADLVKKPSEELLKEDTINSETQEDTQKTLANESTENMIVDVEEKYNTIVGSPEEQEIVKEAKAATKTNTGSIEPYDEIQAWYLGNDITAILQTDGELVIWGDGKARISRPAGSKGYEYIPWIGDERARLSIKRVTIGPDVEIDDMGGWFWFCENLTDISGISIPDTCWRMDNTFYGCSKLTDVSALDIPDSVTSLSGMLAHTGITSVPDDLLPSNAKDISFLFCESSLKNASNFKIPQTVTNAKCAFWQCSELENINGIVIPAGVNTFRMFGNDRLAAGTLTVKGTPSDYRLMFDWSGKDSTGIVVNYTDANSIEKIIETGSDGNVTIGTLN